MSGWEVVVATVADLAKEDREAIFDAIAKAVLPFEDGMHGDIDITGQPTTVYVDEGWWHPNAVRGIVHEHPENPGRNWSQAMHRGCEPVYTRREVRP